MNLLHQPVLLQEIITGLNIGPGDTVIDATLNRGGHLIAFREIVGPNGTLLGVDQDFGAIREARENLRVNVDKSSPNIILLEDDYINLKEIAAANKIKEAKGIIFDLGLSSQQLEISGRGFSFKKDEPLLMTFKENPTYEETAAAFLSAIKKEALIKILREYGEEKSAVKIAEAIIKRRSAAPILTTKDLTETIHQAIGERRGKIDSATQTFQALRIAVNQELEKIVLGLRAALSILKPGGRLAVISFHSLEDGIVKKLFREIATNGLGKIITKKPITPTEEEINQNKRARSAKLRLIEKI